MFLLFTEEHEVETRPARINSNPDLIQLPRDRNSPNQIASTATVAVPAAAPTATPAAAPAAAPATATSGGVARAQSPSLQVIAGATSAGATIGSKGSAFTRQTSLTSTETDDGKYQPTSAVMAYKLQLCNCVRCCLMFVLFFMYVLACVSQCALKLVLAFHF